MAKRTDLYLKRHRDAKGKMTSDFECSMCGIVFRPHPKNQGALTEEFTTHKRLAHSQKTREDVNQASTRIVRDHQPKWPVTKASPAKKPPVNSDDVDALGYWEDDGGPVERGEHK